MKNIFFLFALFIFASSIDAAPRKAAAKVPPNPAVVAPAVPPAPIAEAAKEKQGGFQMRFDTWGGWNFSSSTAWSDLSAQNANINVNKQGPAFGQDITLGNAMFQGGVGVSYVTLGRYSIINVNGSTNLATLPIEGIFNFFPVSGLYIGVRGGYVLDIGSTSFPGGTYTKTNGVSFGGQIGYILSFGTVGINFGAIITQYGFVSVPSTTYLNILPRIGIDFKF